MSKPKYHYIYKITLLCGSLAGHYYIGKHSTTNLYDGYTGSGKIVLDYFKKYSAKECITFTKEILEYNTSDKKNSEREKYYIGDLYDTDPLCLNMKAGGIGGGGRWTEEQKEKFIESNKGHVCTDETKAKISLANTGMKRTEEAKMKMSLAKKGKESTFKGKHHTEEANQKNREAHIGKTMSEETKEKIRNSVKRAWKLKKVS